MAGSLDLEQRSLRLRRATTFVAFGTLLALGAATLPDGTTVIPRADIVSPVDEVWVLLCAALVFFMQAGFLTFEVGLARQVHAGAVAMKNLIDWAVGSTAFFLAGFALMFGPGDMVGGDFWALDGLFDVPSSSISAPTFFLFQLTFAGTAITLISGSLVERTSFLAYVIFSAAVGLVIYPVYGHWVWSGLLLDGNDGWLASIGFRDFAGASVVHTTGAWAALVGVMMIGPRLGRFRPNGTVRAFPISNLPLTALGSLILWFGWLGFNGGSAFGITADVPRLLIVTNLCGVGGLIGASSFAYLVEDRVDIINKMIGGALAGLVASTAGANLLGLLPALVVGVVAGVLYDICYEGLLRLKIDDALGVVPAHGVGGVWGVLSVAIFAPSSELGRSNIEQLGIQSLGLLVNAAWVITTSYIVFKTLQITIGLRVSPQRERGGVQLEADDLPGSPTLVSTPMEENELERLLD